MQVDFEIEKNDQVCTFFNEEKKMVLELCRP